MKSKSLVSFEEKREEQVPAGVGLRSASQSTLPTSRREALGDKSLSDLLNEIIESIKGKSRDKLTFNEAKSIIAQLNLKLLRVYDDEKADKFLDSIGLSRENRVDVETFKSALLDSV